MARQLSDENELDDMECSICTEVFTDPRVLPCIHTFCSKCLLNYGKDRGPGDTMPCPLCRKEFTIPNDGLAGMQKNYFMEKLINARKLSYGSQNQDIPCDFCCGEEGNGNETAKPATKFCVQCQQNYCEQCSRVHAKIKALSDHILVEIGKNLQQDEIVRKFSIAACEIHKSKKIEVFCKECKEAICMMCFIKSHKNHDCSDIDEMSVSLSNEIESDVNKALKLLAETKKLFLNIKQQEKDLIKRLISVEDEINQRADNLIEVIQRDRKKLLLEVESIRLEQVKQVDTLKQEVELHTVALESFTRYTETLLSNGTACDLARSANSLHHRADELTAFDVIGHVQCSLPVGLRFISSAVVNIYGQSGNIVGEIIQDKYPSIAKATRVLIECTSVSAVTSLGDQVFVLRRNLPLVEVYNAVTLTLQNCLAIPGLGAVSYGIAACAINKCLYVSDYANYSIHRTELSGSNAVKTWTLGSVPLGVSVNSSQNVLVVCQQELQELTTHGILVRTIYLQFDIEEPQYAVQLSTNRFLVSHWGLQPRVCQVDATGTVVCGYSVSEGSDVPAGLAVDHPVDHLGNVLVAYQFNDARFALDPSLRIANEMFVDGGMTGPCYLHYDEPCRRLYICECDSGRVIVVDHMDDFTSSA